MKRVEKKSNKVVSSRARENWRRVQEEKRIPAYSTAAQVKKFWEEHPPIGSVADWESETDSSLEVERSQIKEVINLKK